LKIEAIAGTLHKKEAYCLTPEKGRIVILVMNRKTPFHHRYGSRFAWQEIHADVILKGTRVMVFTIRTEKTLPLSSSTLLYLTT
jgi:hypothetical protein